MSVHRAYEAGGEFDLLGQGALLLRKRASERPFWEASTFESAGSWTSTWHEVPAEARVAAVETRLIVYGQPLDMTDWVKFEGNPLISNHGWKHNSPITLVLPEKPPGPPQDQSLVRGTGRFEGEWLVIFNISGWATSGWGAARASTLAPLKSGHNPFELIADPYPLHGPGEGHAPNDWIEVEGTYYSADETQDGPSSIWSSPNLADWTNEGGVEGIVGHDPGLVYTGETFELFTEHSPYIAHCTMASIPGKSRGEHRCGESRNVVKVGGHTGDPDVSFFNNQWHMFMDMNPHGNYKIGHAETDPDGFPTAGWRKTPGSVFGPYDPDQGQKADDPVPDGNDFGTGDFDVALEGHTLYGIWEHPVGLAYNELEEIFETSDQTVEIRIELDEDEDPLPEASTDWHELRGGTEIWSALDGIDAVQGTRFRVRLRASSEEAAESPALTRLELRFAEVERTSCRE